MFSAPGFFCFESMLPALQDPSLCFYQEKFPKIVFQGRTPVELTLTSKKIVSEVSSLSTETLLTNLPDDLSLEDFKKFSFRRWPIETGNNILKSKLGIENFSGCTQNAVFQNF